MSPKHRVFFRDKNGETKVQGQKRPGAFAEPQSAGTEGTLQEAVGGETTLGAELSTKPTEHLREPLGWCF